MIRHLSRALVALPLLTSVAFGQSTINTGQPADDSNLNSLVVRQLATAAASDINNILGMHAATSLAQCPSGTNVAVGEDCLAIGSTPYVWYKWTGNTGGWAQVATINPTSGSVIPFLGAGSITAAFPLTATPGSGTFSLGLNIDSNFAVNGSNQLALTPGNGNLVLATPNGNSGEPTLRALVGADLPNPSASSLGGVQSIATVAHQWVNSISTAGLPSLSQPSFSDISGQTSLTQLGGLGTGVPTALGGALNGSGGLVGFSGNLGAASGTSLLLGSPAGGLSGLAFAAPSARFAAAAAGPTTININDGALSNTTIITDSPTKLSLTNNNVPIELDSGNGGTLNSGQLVLNTDGSVSMSGKLSAANIGTIDPQGRLTLTSATPVMGTSVGASTTVFYTPYVGSIVPIFNGTNFVPTAFAEVSQATTDTTKSPAAVAASSCYDEFAWVDVSTNRVTRGPAWTSLTTRSAGTALAMVQGIFLNSVSITNGPAAQRGTYVGTICSNSGSTIDYLFGGFSSGASPASFGVWNAYNRVPVGTAVGDTVNSWTNTAIGVRAANNNTNFRISAVRGLDQDAISAKYNAMGTPGATTAMGAGVCLNSTSATSGTAMPMFTNSTATIQGVFGEYTGLMGLGFVFVQACETQNTTTASTWDGFTSSIPAQSGLHATLWQ